MRREGHRIKNVEDGSIAWEMGVLPGTYLISVNGTPVEDVFDYRYLMNDEQVNVLIREENGEETLLEIEKESWEDLGIEFESSLMDDYRNCCNRCIFCFIDQMPKGMRETLYFKDDDSRLSFLQGNYVTLTNMKDSDIDRIIRYHMEPINISVHTTNPALRCSMLGNRFAGDVFPRIRALADAGILMNGQVVLCRGINDGEELDRTIRDLSSYRPAMRSVSIVPVGLTKYRDGLAPLTPFDRESAGQVIDQIEDWQKRLAADGVDPVSPHFVHASDEWYILAGRELPEEERYDGYLQLENGVGMVRLLENEVREALGSPAFLREADEAVDGTGRKVILACGKLIESYLKKFTGWIMERWPHVEICVRAIRNDFFGERITVSGLITGGDLIRQLRDMAGCAEELLIPVSMLRSGEKVFLDDLTTEDVTRELGIPIRITWTGGEEFLRACLGMKAGVAADRQVYESWE